MPSSTALPVIDLAAVRRGEPDAWNALARELDEAARNIGFFYLSGHGVASTVFDALLQQTQIFFAAPLAEKMEVYIGRSRNHRGYVPEGEEVFAGGAKDKKEAFDLSFPLSELDPDYIAGNPLLGPNIWPHQPGFQLAAEAYYAEAFAVGRLLLGGFSIALGMDRHALDRHVTRPPSQLRLVHYPFDADARDAPGIGAHTDYECFTLLRATAPGLEVLNGDGEWIDAPPLEDAFIVNIGDMMEVLSNGLFHATSHRVRKVQQERFSFPLFFSFDYQTAVAPLSHLIVEGEAPRQGLVAGEHLFAQTVQTFSYQKARLARGEVVLPTDARGLSSFGRRPDDDECERD